MSTLLQRLSRLPADLPLTLGARVNVRPEERVPVPPGETLLRCDDYTGEMLVKMDDGKLFYDAGWEQHDCKTASDERPRKVKAKKSLPAIIKQKRTEINAALGLPYATEPAKVIDDHLPPCPPTADQGLRKFKVGERASFGIGPGTFMDGTHDMLSSRQRIVVKAGMVVHVQPAYAAYLFGNAEEPKGSPHRYYVHDHL